MKKNKLGIIGHFGGNKKILDGQTVKTKILYEELEKKTNWKIKKIDTYYKKTNPIKLIFQTILAIIECKSIVILLSSNGMKIYFPLLYCCSKFLNKKIFHDVIGGNLDENIKKYPRYKKYLNSFEYNWVETNGLKQRLEDLGVNNCEVIPNFKRLDIISENEIVEKKDNKVYRFCTFSRVIKEKGIEEAINAVKGLNDEKYKNLSYMLDIYGPIDKNYENDFKNIIEKSYIGINYCGQVPFDKSVNILKKYDALLFPTYWEGECFPGTIVDAFSAGLPVIATDWNSNSEIVNNNLNGIIYPNKEILNLSDAIKALVSKSEFEQMNMKKECIKGAKLFQPDKYIDLIIKRINKEEDK